MTKESNLYLFAAWLSPILLLMNLLCRSYNGSAKVVLLFYSSKLFVIFFKIYFKILITQIPFGYPLLLSRTAFRERKDRTLFSYFKTFAEVFFEIVMRDSGNYANKHNPIYLSTQSIYTRI